MLDQFVIPHDQRLFREFGLATSASLLFTDDGSRLAVSD
jgi:hypothetical protein